VKAALRRASRHTAARRDPLSGASVDGA